MKDIIFEQPSLHTKVSSSKVETHQWKGFNISSKTIQVTHMGVSCGCFSYEQLVEVPPHSEFYVTTYINKVNKSGLFSVSLTIKFSNDQTEILKLSGQIE